MGGGRKREVWRKRIESGAGICTSRNSDVTASSKNWAGQLN